MSALTPEQRRLRASLGAHTSWANTKDRRARTAAAREARWQRYITRAREIQGADASEDVVAAAAEHLRRADLQRMALESARARRKRAGTAETQPAAGHP